jgi:hypothetical protein
MAKHYVYGNGSFGCMYDSQGACETKEDAIECLKQVFYDLSEHAYARMVADLREYGYHAFDRGADSESDELDGFCPGADYCEISEEDGPCPEIDEY